MKEFRLKESEIKELTTIKGGCIVSDKITVEGKKVGYMYRETPTNETDSGWRFFAGDESDDYTENPNNFSMFQLNTICNYDPDIIPLLEKEIGKSFAREENGIFKEL